MVVVVTFRKWLFWSTDKKFFIAGAKSVHCCMGSGYVTDSFGNILAKWDGGVKAMRMEEE